MGISCGDIINWIIQVHLSLALMHFLGTIKLKFQVVLCSYVYFFFLWKQCFSYVSQVSVFLSTVTNINYFVIPNLRFAMTRNSFLYDHQGELTLLTLVCKSPFSVILLHIFLHVPPDSPFIGFILISALKGHALCAILSLLFSVLSH